MDEDMNNLFSEEPQNAGGTSELAPGQAEPGSLDNGLEDIPMEVTKKKRTMKPVPKLDVNRLLGARGLPCLSREFENVKFKGKGNEVEDLELLMSNLEHWAHRLYPKMMFDDCLEKIEKLGHKKEIRTCIKKIRMGMPLVNSGGETTIITEDGPVDTENDDLGDDELLADVQLSPQIDEME